MRAGGIGAGVRDLCRGGLEAQVVPGRWHVVLAVRRPRLVKDRPGVVRHVDRGPVPVKQLLNKELNEVIQNSLALLDEDKRLVFTLKVFQQCSYEEIAEITGFSIPKLKTDLHRARTEMRRRVGQYVRV